MLTTEDLKQRLLEDIPDAEVNVRETKSKGDHFGVEIKSAAFEGLPRIEQHRKVYASLQDWLDDGSIHALSIKTEAREREHAK